MNDMGCFYLVLFLAGPVVIIAAVMIYKRGFVGAMIGGKIEKTCGDIKLSTSLSMIVTRFKVHRLANKNGGSFIGLEHNEGMRGIEATGTLKVIKLSKEDAKQVSSCLNEAVKEIDNRLF